MSYQSPFSVRYGSPDMRDLWSEAAQRRIWRRIWVAVARAQADAGLVADEQVSALVEHQDAIDIARAAKLEAEIGHDLVAELKVFAEQCGEAGSILHWGLTSADIKDNADVIRQRTALALILRELRTLLLNFSRQIEAHAGRTILGYTHLQPAEPTTLGFRLSGYAQDLSMHFERLARARIQLRGKGIRGAVGTAASLLQLLEGDSDRFEAFEGQVMKALDLEPFAVTTQIYPRVQDHMLLSALAGLAASLHRFAFDLRLMQSPGFSTASEPFGEEQIGSSAMPFKRNPVAAERICSLSRTVQMAAGVAWENAASNLLERTLDDSANRRALIPEAFLACDEMIRTAASLVENLEVDEAGIEMQLKRFGAFTAQGLLLTELVRAGADRQEMHERLRQHSLASWEALAQERPNPLVERLTGDTALLAFLQPARIRALLEAEAAVGLAPRRAQAMAAQIRERLQVGAHPEA